MLALNDSLNIRPRLCYPFFDTHVATFRPREMESISTRFNHVDQPRRGVRSTRQSERRFQRSPSAVFEIMADDDPLQSALARALTVWMLEQHAYSAWGGLRWLVGDAERASGGLASADGWMTAVSVTGLENIP